MLATSFDAVCLIFSSLVWPQVLEESMRSFELEEQRRRLQVEDEVLEPGAPMRMLP